MKWTKGGVKLAVIGATGLVGRTFMDIIEASDLEVSKIIPYASQSSEGKIIEFGGRKLEVEALNREKLDTELDIAFSTASKRVSENFAPLLVEKGVRVIDNTSAFRLDESVPLVVPEVNFGSISTDDYLIANPNCSTIQLSLVLAPLDEHYGVKRVVVSTYQAVSGAGSDSLNYLKQGEDADGPAPENLKYPIHNNVVPVIGSERQSGYFTEELKLIYESKKILNDSTLDITATAVRVPVENCHGESVNIELEADTDLKELERFIGKLEGVQLQKNSPPMPINTDGKRDVYVGRIRPDITHSNTFNMWIVGDNLKKGAALNGFQIGKRLINSFIEF